MLNHYLEWSQLV